MAFTWDLGNSDMHRNHFGLLVTIAWDFFVSFAFDRSFDTHCQYNWSSIGLFAWNNAMIVPFEIHDSFVAHQLNSKVMIETIAID